MIDDNKLYYTIGEVSDLLDSSTSQLRYWSGEFKLNVRKNRKGDRLFQKKDLAILETIKKLLKDEGYTIDGARKRLAELKKSDGLEPIPTDIKEPIHIDEPIQVVENQAVKTNNNLEVISKLQDLKNKLEKLKIEVSQLG